MRRFLGLSVVCLAAVAGCIQPSQPQERMSWVPSQDLDKVGLQVSWELTAKDLDLDSGEGLQWIHRLQKNVYCLTTGNRLIALDADTGVFRWTTQVAPEGQRVYRPLHVSNLLLTEKLPNPAEIMDPKTPPLPLFDAVVINSANLVLVIDRKSGRTVRRVDLEHGAASGGATDGAMFYAGTAQGLYYAVSLEMGLKVWTLFAGDAIRAPLECAGGMVYVAAVDGSVHVAKTGRVGGELYEKALGGRVTAPMHVDNRGCFVPCEDNFLYAFTPDISQKLWDHPFACRGPLRRGVQVGERTVFQRAEGDKLYAINLVDGQERWNLPKGLEVLAVAGTEDTYVRTTDNHLLLVHETLGTVKATASLGGYDLFVCNATDPVIYAAWHQGRLACLKPLSAGRVTPEMLQKTQK